VKRIARTEKIDESKEFARDVQESLARNVQKSNRMIKDRGVRKARVRMDGHVRLQSAHDGLSHAAVLEHAVALLHVPRERFLHVARDSFDRRSFRPSIRFTMSSSS